jgi:hypothetical protein
MQVNVKQVKAQRHQIYPVVQLATKAGLRPRCWDKPQGLWDLFQSAPPSHLYQGNRRSVPLSLICNYKLLGAATTRLGASKRPLAV